MLAPTQMLTDVVKVVSGIVNKAPFFVIGAITGTYLTPINKILHCMCGHMGVWACGRVGMWMCGRVGVWGVWACGCVGVVSCLDLSVFD